MAITERGLTTLQTEFLDAFWDTQTEARVGRRIEIDPDNPDSFERYRLEFITRPYTIASIAVAVDREMLEARGFRVDAALTTTKILDHYRGSNRISAKLYEHCVAFTATAREAARRAFLVA